MPTRPLGWGVFGDDFDNLFEGFFRPLAGQRAEPQGGAHTPPIDIVEQDKGYLVRVDLPGVKPDDIEVTVHDGVLTVSAETREEKEQKEGERVIRKERRVGRYLRSLRLGSQVDESKVSASYHDGVLEITVPKVEEATPKRVQVKAV